MAATDDDQPDVTPGPDVDAGGAGDEVYRAAGLALVPYGDDEGVSLFEWHACQRCPGGPCACAGAPYPSEPVRAAIDAGRAPLIAERDELRQRLRDQRDASTRLRAALADMGRIHAETVLAPDDVRLVVEVGDDGSAT